MPRPRPLSCVLTTRGALLLALVPAHLKSGGDNGDEFRRALESFRLRQIANAANRDAVPLIMLGDMNADSGDPPLYPERFTSVPSGLPTGLPRR